MEPQPLSLNHAKRLRKLHRKKYRDREGLFLAEGLNACEEALKGVRYALREIILSDDLRAGDRNRIAGLLPSRPIPLYSCSRKEMDDLSSEEQARGIVAVCETVDFSLASLGDLLPDTMIYLDGIADPGNLGTIIRTSLWFGVDHVLLGPSSVDPFNSKVVRASAGAIFSVSLYRDVSAGGILSFADRMGYTLTAASVRGGIPPAELNKSKKQILMLGSEAQGLSPELARQTHNTVTIPGAETAESLNLAAAAAILLYELHRP